MYSDLYGYGYKPEDVYEMDLNELLAVLKGNKERLGYQMWKQAYFIMLGISDVMAKKSKADFPGTPQDGAPELYPPKFTIKKPDFLKGVR